MTVNSISYYGVLEKTEIKTDIDIVVEEIKHLGFSIIDSGLSPQNISKLGACFNEVHAKYIETYGLDYLQEKDEHNTIRLPLAFDRNFLDLVQNARLLSVLKQLIPGKFILNQQNGIVNPVKTRYNQDAWHRDLPYQHFVCSRPIAINALFCIDDFTLENGSTIVLPASHKHEYFPSNDYILKHQKQVTAPAGSFIILDCMLYHKGGKNNSSQPRRAINHVFTIPYIKQQINIPSIIDPKNLESHEYELLGYRYNAINSVKEFIDQREGHIYDTE